MLLNGEKINKSIPLFIYFCSFAYVCKHAYRSIVDEDKENCTQLDNQHETAEGKLKGMIDVDAEVVKWG